MKREYQKVCSAGTQEIGFNIVTLGKKGKKDICFVCGIHGNEITPIYLVNELIKKESRLTNEVTIILDANQASLAMNLRENPLDKVDMNRVFPGNKGGSITQRIASAIFERVKKNNLVIELHTFEQMQMNPFCILPDINDAYSLEAIKSFEPDLVWVPELQEKKEAIYNGALSVALRKQGNSSFAIEFPPDRILNEEAFVDFSERLISLINGVESARNFLFVRRVEIIASRAGLFKCSKKLGAFIDSNQVIGEVQHITSNEKTKVFGQEGSLFQIRCPSYVNEGEVLCAIGIPLNSPLSGK